MPTTLTTYLTRMGYQLQDTATVQYNDTIKKAWFNAGKDQLAAMRPYVLTNANLSGVNGSANSFDLASLTRFMRVRGVSIPASGGAKIARDPKGMDNYRRLQIAGSVIAGTPAYYYVQGTTIYFDKIPPSGTVITIDYWQYEADKSSGTDTMSGLLATGWDDLVLGFAMLQATNDVQEEFALKLRARVIDEIFGSRNALGKRTGGRFNQFCDFVAAELSLDTEELPLPYSDISVAGYYSTLGLVQVSGSNPVIVGTDYWE